MTTASSTPRTSIPWRPTTARIFSPRRCRGRRFRNVLQRIQLHNPVCRYHCNPHRQPISLALSRSNDWMCCQRNQPGSMWWLGVAVPLGAGQRKSVRATSPRPGTMFAANGSSTACSAAQAGVIISTFAIAARRRNLLWSMAAGSGLIAIAFEVYVYFRM